MARGRRRTYEELALVGVVAFGLFIIETVTGGIGAAQRHSFEVSVNEPARAFAHVALCRRCI
jgi:hypothetical protein